MADVDHREFMAVVEQKQWMNRRASTDEGNSFQGGSSRSNTVYPIARFVFFFVLDGDERYFNLHSYLHGKDCMHGYPFHSTFTVPIAPLAGRPHCMITGPA